MLPHFKTFNVTLNLECHDTALSLTLAKLVDLPTPLTPQKVITYGLLSSLAFITSLKMSTRRFGVSIFIRASSILAFTCEVTPTGWHGNRSDVM